MTKTVLVTGAEGFIGSHLVKFLETKAWRVIGTYQGNGIDSFPKLPNLSFVPCDLRDQQRMEQVLKSIWARRACRRYPVRIPLKPSSQT